MKKSTKILSVVVMTLVAITSLFLSACFDFETSTSSDGDIHVCEYVSKVIKEATCTEDGEENIVCTSCGEVYEINVIPATGHSFGEWYETKPATCKEEGEQYKDCVNCDFFDTRMIPVIDHDYSYRIDVLDEPNCLNPGYGNAYCVCGDKKDIVLEQLDHEYENGFCVVCKKGDYEIVGDYLYFGEYPQTIKAENVTITEETNEKGYYLGSDGEWYVKLTANPADTNYKFSNGESVTDEREYYFKVEPIKWQILSNDGQTLSVVCASIIENYLFDDDSSNYAESLIREWLNNDFYNKAFKDSQKPLIVTKTVDNSAESTGDYFNSFVCDNTQDKIYLLSYKEAFDLDNTTESSEVKERLTSDYTMANGVYQYVDDVDYYGNGYWWLRSPNCDDGTLVCACNLDGTIITDCLIDDTTVGIVPALTITIG